MINTLIFDFGAVLLPIDEHKTHIEFKYLGANYELFDQTEIFHQLEKGNISEDEFLEQIRPFFFRRMFKPDLVNAWNAMLISPIQSEIIDFLNKLSSDYLIILLSNTNTFHVKHIRSSSGPFLYKQFTKHFDKIYYSNEVGMRKPDSEIFDLVISENDLTPENCFYIDDKLENIEAGMKAGFKTWHLKPMEEGLIRDFDRVLSTHHD